MCFKVNFSAVMNEVKILKKPWVLGLSSTDSKLKEVNVPFWSIYEHVQAVNISIHQYVNVIMAAVRLPTLAQTHV